MTPNKDGRSYTGAVRAEYIARVLTAPGISYGECHCGCGQKTRIATKTQLTRFMLAGEPTRYLRGHSARCQQPNDYVVDPETDCWLWQRHKDRGGYGIAWDSKRKKNVRAHRLYYERHKGPIPPDHHIDHAECDTPACVNPDHLVAKLPMENIRRGNSKLTMKDAIAIRGSTESGRELAEHYGVSRSVISAVRAGRSFKQRVFFDWDVFAAAPERPLRT